mmetsp:Transcript_71745/g.131364  ORF Transcript_71745/g.131364 Transcript_71745/m.131364 type:complete len:224 (-) Transcript_71745:843-1514(-)
MNSASTPQSTWSKSVFIDLGRLAKSSLKEALSLSSSVNKIPKMKTVKSRRSRIANTDRIAVANPLIKIISSGTARDSLSMRGTRVSLTSRKHRKSCGKVALASPSSLRLKNRYSTTSIHVSQTMNATKTESNTNIVSEQAERFRENDRKRTTNSNTNHVQKRLSMTCDMRGALMRISEWSISVSTPIQSTLRVTTMSDTVENHESCRAQAWQMPVFSYKSSTL